MFLIVDLWGDEIKHIHGIDNTIFDHPANSHGILTVTRNIVRRIVEQMGGSHITGYT